MIKLTPTGAKLLAIIGAAVVLWAGIAALILWQYREVSTAMLLACFGPDANVLVAGKSFDETVFYEPSACEHDVVRVGAVGYGPACAHDRTEDRIRAVVIS